jgi:hypothetical protein
MSLKLSKMIDTFNLQGLTDKPFFPYLYNKHENMHGEPYFENPRDPFCAPSLPPKEAYCYA